VSESLSAARDRKNQVIVHADGTKRGTSWPYDVTEIIKAELHCLSVEPKSLEDAGSNRYEPPVRWLRFPVRGNARTSEEDRPRFQIVIEKRLNEERANVRFFGIAGVREHLGYKQTRYDRAGHDEPDDRRTHAILAGRRSRRVPRWKEKLRPGAPNEPVRHRFWRKEKLRMEVPQSLRQR
jgi:hypothetical protein